MDGNGAIAALLQKILALTEEQGALVRAEDKDGLLESLDRRERMITELQALPRGEKTDAERELEKAIAARSAENLRAARGELSRLGESSRKTREGMAAASLYDGVGADVGSTYFDRGR